MGHNSQPGIGLFVDWHRAVVAADYSKFIQERLKLPLPLLKREISTSFSTSLNVLREVCRQFLVSLNLSSAPGKVN